MKAETAILTDQRLQTVARQGVKSRDQLIMEKLPYLKQQKFNGNREHCAFGTRKKIRKQQTTPLYNLQRMYRVQKALKRKPHGRRNHKEYNTGTRPRIGITGYSNK